MNIHITGRHVDITQGLSDHISEKFSHLKKFFEHVNEDAIDVHVVLLVEHGQNISEANMHIPHQPTVHAKAEAGDMYSSIDMLGDKLKVQIMKHKSKELTERDHPKQVDEGE